MTEKVNAAIERIMSAGTRGIAGAPAVFAPQFANDLHGLRGDRGARSVIDAHRDATVVIPFEDAAVDIDTESDYGSAAIRNP